MIENCYSKLVFQISYQIFFLNLSNRKIKFDIWGWPLGVLGLNADGQSTDRGSDPRRRRMLLFRDNQTK